MGFSRQDYWSGVLLPSPNSILKEMSILIFNKKFISEAEMEKREKKRKGGEILNCLISRVTLEKAMAPHSSTLAWKIPRKAEPGRLQSMGSLRVRHD